jgi:hypothetical protein
MWPLAFVHPCGALLPSSRTSKATHAFRTKLAIGEFSLLLHSEKTRTRTRFPAWNPTTQRYQFLSVWLASGKGTLSLADTLVMVPLLSRESVAVGPIVGLVIPCYIQRRRYHPSSSLASTQPLLSHRIIWKEMGGGSHEVVPR